MNPLLNEIPLEDTPAIQTEFEDGSVEFEFDEDIINSTLLLEGTVNINKDFYKNLAEELDEQKLQEISEGVMLRFEADKNSRSQWLETVNSGLSLLGIHVEETNDPFPGACSAHHPLILEAAVKFQAKAANELFNPKGPVKTQVLGESDPEKEEQSLRVKNHMNYQVLYQMEEYFDETEAMLFYLPIVGSAFKKTYYDALLDRPVSVFVPVDKFVVNYYATSLKTAPCFSHLIDRSANDLKKDIRNGMYRDCDLGEAYRGEQGSTEIVVDELLGNFPDHEDEVFTLVEQYCNLDLDEDEDGIALPYVVTVEINSGKVLSVRRNWGEEDKLRNLICPFVHYKFVPGLGFYGLGFIHLLGNLQMTLTSAMRNLVDSGSFATMQGGFVDKRLRVRKNEGPLQPGEFREVEAGGLALRDAIINIPFKEPSQTLFAMYQFIEARGQKFADSTEQVIADSTNYGPVGTTMALLEASTKFFSGVHKRLHKAQKQEFKILAALNYSYLGESETFDVVGKTFEISKEDYDGRIDVVPVSDPNMSSQAQKMSVAQVISTNMTTSPDIHDRRAVLKYSYQALGLEEDEIEKILPEPQEATQNDPITDIINVQQGKPIKAFQGQDHQSHIAIKTAFINDPMAGQNPVMGQLIPVIQANIQEHVILDWTAKTQAMTQGNTTEPALAQAAKTLAEQNAKLAELQAVGPDEARNKLADAELLRVTNESRKLEVEIQDKIAERTYKALELELKKYAEDNKLLIAELQAQVKAKDIEMKQMTDLIKQALDLKAAAEGQDKQLQSQEKQMKAKQKPSKVD